MLVWWLILSVWAAPSPSDAPASLAKKQPESTAAAAATPPAAPAGARLTGQLSSGTRVRIVALSEGDGYFGQRDEIVGLTCTLGSDTDAESDGWFSGQVNACSNGDSYYFYEAAYVLAAEAPAPVPARSNTARLTGPVSSGTRVRVADISPEDSYYEDRADIIGVTCTLKGDARSDGDGWFSGAAEPCSNGRTYYFFEAAYEAAPSPKAPPVQKSPGATP